MNDSTINRATHFSIVWGVVLAVLTLVEWSSLEREPMTEQIYLPFIEREITLAGADVSAIRHLGARADDLPVSGVAASQQTQVKIEFNGPLFLAYFFIPILMIHVISLLLRRLGKPT